MAIKFTGSEAYERAASKRGIILRHIRNWEFTDAQVIAKLLDLKRTATFTTIQNMIDAGLIDSHRVSGCPTAILHLTPAGASAVHQVMQDDEYAGMHSVVYPSKLNLTHVQHDLLVQRFVADMMKERKIDESLSTRQIIHTNKEIGRKRLGSSAKIPDALIIQRRGNTNNLIALEVQQSAEPDHILERKLSNYFEAIKSKELYAVMYASTSRARLEQVNRIWFGKLRRWWYNSSQKKWFAVNPEQVLFDEEIINTRMIPRDITRWSPGLYQHVIL